MPGPYSSSDERNYFGFGKQTAKGTDVAPSVFIPYIGGLDVGHGMSGDEVREAGTGVYLSRMSKTGHDPSGSVKFRARPTTVGKLLAWFFGADTVTGAGPFTHTMVPSTTDLWVTGERNIADEIIERFFDGLIRKITLSGDGGGDLMVGLEWDSLSAEWQTAATTESYEAAAPFQMQEATYTIDGSGATNVRSWSVELEWVTDDDVRLSKITRDQLPRLAMKGSVKVKQLIANTTDYRAANYGTASATTPSKDYKNDGSFSVNFNDGAAGTSNRQLTVTLNKLTWREAEVTEPNPEGETVYLDRTGTMVKTTTTVQAVAITGDSAAYV